MTEQQHSLIVRLLDSQPGTLLVSSCFTLVMIFRYVFPLNALLIPGWQGNDTYGWIWSLWYANESITHGRNPFVTDLLYYPFGASLSHHALSSGYFPLTFLVKLFTAGDVMYPIYAYRIAILVSFTLMLWSSYLLLREFNFSRWAAAAAAVAYAFGDFYMLHAPLLIHTSGFFIPLTALFVVRSFKRPASPNPMIAAALAAYSIYFTEFTLFIYLAALLTLVALLLFPNERRLLFEKIRQAGTRRLVVSLGIFVLIQLPFVIGFLQSRTLRPSYTEISRYSANVAGFLIPSPDTTRLYGDLFGPLPGKISTGMAGFEIFIGFPIAIFAVVGIIRTKERSIRISALLGLFFLVLSLGPTLKIFGSETGIPLPYSLLMHVPPFDVGRTPVRFVVIAFLFLMIVAGAGMSEMQKAVSQRFGPRWAMAAMALLFLWVAAETYSPIAKQPAFVPPRALEKITAGPVLNLPPYFNDGYAMMLQVFHRQPIAAGYLSRYTNEQLQYIREWRKAADLGGQAFCDRARELGFRNIVINPTEVTQPGELGSVIPADLSRCSINVVDLRDDAASAGGPFTERQEMPDNFPPYTPGTRLDLREDKSRDFLWFGWGESEPEYRWTDRGKAAVVFALAEIKPAVLRIRMGAFLNPGRLNSQRIIIKLNDRELTTLTITEGGLKEYSVPLPFDLLRNRNILTFDLPDAEAPVTLGLSDDRRLLAISVQWLEIENSK